MIEQELLSLNMVRLKRGVLRKPPELNSYISNNNTLSSTNQIGTHRSSVRNFPIHQSEVRVLHRSLQERWRNGGDQVSQGRRPGDGGDSD